MKSEWGSMNGRQSAQPVDTTRERNPKLVVLPQHPLPVENNERGRQRDNSVFLDQTEAGGWYVMPAGLYAHFSERS